MYTTQMDAARQGIITPQMKIVAEKERMDAEEIRSLVAKGQVIIPCNKNHKALHPSGVGARLTTKINVNLGVSRDWKDVDMEYEKVRSAVEMGAEAIMDLSSYGDTRSFRRKLTADCPAMIGTVPIYDAVVYYHKPLAQITAEEWLDIVRMHPALRHHQKNHRSDPQTQTENEYRFPRRLHHVCMDGNDRQRKPLL